MGIKFGKQTGTDRQTRPNKVNIQNHGLKWAWKKKNPNKIDKTINLNNNASKRDRTGRK